MTAMTGMTRTEKRLEGGWFQRIAWTVLAWGSLGMLTWIPFLYVAIRRGRVSDWGAFASFALYEAITLGWAGETGSDDDTVFGLVILICQFIAAIMLLFAVFDRPTPKPLPVPGYAPRTTPAPGAYGYPYGH